MFGYLAATDDSPADKASLFTRAKVAVGVGVVGLLWVMFGKKRRK